MPKNQSLKPKCPKYPENKTIEKECRLKKGCINSPTEILTPSSPLQNQTQKIAFPIGAKWSLRIRQQCIHFWPIGKTNA